MCQIAYSMMFCNIQVLFGRIISGHKLKDHFRYDLKKKSWGGRGSQWPGCWCGTPVSSSEGGRRPKTTWEDGASGSPRTELPPQRQEKGSRSHNYWVGRYESTSLSKYLISSRYAPSANHSAALPVILRQVVLAWNFKRPTLPNLYLKRYYS